MNTLLWSAYTYESSLPNLVLKFIFGHAGSSLLHWWELLSSCSVQASLCNGFSSCCRVQRLQQLQFQALGCRLHSCGAWAQLLRSMWGLPGPGIKPMSPVLAGGFLTTEPPGKPQIILSVLRPRKRNTLGQVQHRLNYVENFFKTTELQLNYP